MINDHTTALLCSPIPGFHWPTMTYCILIDLHTKDHNIDKHFVQMTPPVANVRCLCGSTVTFSLFFLQAAENEDGGDSHRRAPSWCTPHHAAWYRKRYSKRWMSRWNEKDQHFPFGHEVSLVEYNTSYWGECVYHVYNGPLSSGSAGLYTDTLRGTPRKDAKNREPCVICAKWWHFTKQKPRDVPFHVFKDAKPFVCHSKIQKMAQPDGIQSRLISAGIKDARSVF